jgi:hypothetical protein
VNVEVGIGNIGGGRGGSAGFALSVAFLAAVRAVGLRSAARRARAFLGAAFFADRLAAGRFAAARGRLLLVRAPARFFGRLFYSPHHRYVNFSR